MRGPLARLPGLLNKAFAGKCSPATLWRLVPAQPAQLDTFGDPIAGTPTTWACQGFRDAFSDYFRATAGIPETDAKLCIFAASLPAGITPQIDDMLQMEGAWWQLRGAQTDPATALWIAPGFQVPGPAA